MNFINYKLKKIMKVTSQQLLVLFDIAKGCLYSSEEHFAGYSKDEIMKLLNQIISQQDNTELLELESKYKTDVSKITTKTTETEDLSDENFWE